MRLLMRIFLYGALAALGAASAALWWAGSPRSLEWAVARIERAAQGRLEVRGATGSLLTGARAREIRFKDRDLAVAAAGVAFEWSPLDLLGWRLVISRLRAHALSVELHEASGPPPPLPAALMPRIPIEVSEASVGELVIARGARVERFTDLSLRLTGDRQAWRVNYGRVVTPWGRVQAQFELGSAPPFPLNGTAEWRIDTGRGPITAHVRLGGTVSEFDLQMKGEAKGAAVTVAAHFAPLQENPVRRLRAQARGFDPKRWAKDWPRADVHGELALEAVPEGSLAGKAALHNKRAGTVDQEKIPLQGLTARIAAAQGAVRLEDLVLDLGEAGRIAGTAVWRDGVLRLDGAAHDLNLRGVHGRLKATALRGAIRIEGDEASQHVTARLAQSNQAIELDGSVSAQRFALERAELRVGKSVLEGSGEIGLQADRPFRFEGRLARFDPSELGEYPAARIDADIGVSGTLAPELQARAEFRIRENRLLEHRLRGKGRFSISARGIEQAQADLLVAGNELALEGGLGTPQQRLHWRVNAPRLEGLDPRLAGRIRGSGYLGGALDRLEIGFELEAERLRVNQAHGIERLHAKGRLEPGENGSVVGDVTLEGYRGPAVSLRRAALVLRGARLDHTAEFTATGEQMDLAARLRGAFSERQWRGTLEQFSNNRGPLQATLERAAPLAVFAGGYTLSEAVFRLPSGRIAIKTLAQREEGLDAQGSASGLPLAWLLERSGVRTEPLRVDLRLGAEWSLRFAETLNGALKVWREEGSVTVASKPPLVLQAQRLDVGIRLVENRLSLDVQIDAGRALRLAAQAASELSRRGGRWGIAGEAPLVLAGTVSAESLEWLGPIVPVAGIDTAGALRAEFAASGTVGAPAITGRVTGSGLRALWADQGLDLKDGELAATFNGDELTLERLVLRGGEGQLEASGAASFGAQPRLSIKAAASRLQLISRPDRLLVVSGGATLALVQGKVEAAGKLRADRGAFELLPQTVVVSDDVVVLGAQPKPIPAAQMPLRAEVEFDFGPDFTLKGRGIDARLAGVLRLLAAEARPLAVHGNVSVTQGTYRAYGQKLSIERGVLNFAGPVDDPRLDILALRKGLQVEAGVEVLGTLLSPRVRLVSSPAVSDAEKLSWLALGHGFDRSSRGEIGVLARAASTLLASEEAESLQSELAEAGGLDEVAIGGGGGLENTVVTLGKRLSSRAYVSFEQGLVNATSVLNIQYELSRRWSVRAQTGTANAVDLFYFIRFD